MSDSLPPDPDRSTKRLYADPPEREGLPPGYRMRHDRHYVDELDSRSPGVLVRMLPTRDIRVVASIELDETAALVKSVRRVGVLQPLLVRRAQTGYELISGARRMAAATAAGLAEVPCRVFTADEVEAKELAEADDVRGDLGEDVRGGPEAAEPLAVHSEPTGAVSPLPALAELADSLRAASSCWDMCANGADRPYVPVVREVTRIELQRATWLVESLQVLTGTRPIPTRRRFMAGSLLEQMLRLTQTECRLADVAVSTDFCDDPVEMHADEGLLLTAFGGLMSAVVAVARSAAPASIRCTLAKSASVAQVVISQTCAGVSEAFGSRFVEVGWGDRPGGQIAAVYAAAANCIVEAHGGRIVVELLRPVGLSVTVTLPVESSADL